MANDKTYDRHINIWINGKEVKNDVASIQKEMFKLNTEVKKATIGSKEYYEKTAELKKIKGILQEHQQSIKSTSGFWNTLKGSFGLAMGALGAAYGIFQSFKTILESTDASSDKLAKTMGGVQGAIGEVSRSMASNSFKDFWKNIRGAVEEGQRYTDMLDSIGDSSRALSLEEEKVATKILNLKIIQADATKSREEQIKAGEEIERLASELADKRADQAQKVLDNEMDNAVSKSKLSKEIIVAYLEQNSALMKNMEIGKKYFDLVQKLNELSTTQILLKGGAIKTEMEALGENAPKFAAVYASMSKVTDDHRIRIVAAEKEVAAAKRSATDDILRQIIRLNNARAAETKLVVTAAEVIKADTFGLEDVITKALQNPGYNPDEFIAKESEKLFATEQELNAQREEAAAEAEKKKGEALIKAGEEGKQQAIKNWADIKAIDQQNLEQKIQKYQEFGAKIGDIVGNAMANGTMSAREAAKEMINIALDELSNFAIISIGRATVGSMTTPDSILTGGISGAIRAAVLTGLIKAAVGSVKSIINKNLWSGGYAEGYTGPGGKYTPAGIVHKGEWVANADMVASPATGPIIRALEMSRTGSKQSYASGGLTSEGQSRSSASGTGSLFPSDPKLQNTMDAIAMFLAKLDANGVRNIYTWKDVDSLQNGMDKLDGLKDGVTSK